MQPPNLCIHFQRGFCSYGSNCRFLHQQVGAFAHGGGRFGGARWTQTEGRGGRGGGRFSYYHESKLQISTGALNPASRPVPAREWSAPLNEVDLPDQGTSFNFRFMSWNILAAELAHTHAGELYPQAHHSSLAWPRRLAAVVSHVAAQRPDVLCLQEVDDWPGLRRELAALGYDGVHVQRTGGRGDGCATLWLRHRLRLAGGSRPTSRPAPDLEEEPPESGSGSAFRKSGSGGRGVHKIRMADHGLKDNVALLVHLMPRRGAAAGCIADSAAAEAPEVAAGAGGKGGSNTMDASAGTSGSGGSGYSSSSSSNSSSGDDGEVEDRAKQVAQRPEGRRPKRTRQRSGEGAALEAAAAAAANAAIASLRPHPPVAGGGGGKGGAAIAAQRTNGQAAVGRLPSHIRKGFWVANTHILFNTKRGDVKLGQLRVILSELAARASEEEEQEAVGLEEPPGAGASSAAPLPPTAVPVIFAGDFNTAPGSGLYRFLRHGSLQLAAEDRRELSGQVEGYGYAQLQRDAMSGRPVRLARWGPATATAGFASQQAAVQADYRYGAGTMYGTASSSSVGMDEWRLASRQWQGQGQQQVSYGGGVRWDEEELVHALGRTTLTRLVAEVRQSAEAGGNGSGGGAPGGPQAQEYLNGNAHETGRFRSGFDPGAPGGGGQRPWRAAPTAAAAMAAAQWLAVTQAAVVRHPLQLRSAYASLDEQEREPLFTTLHARYVGTVDFIWYTPGEGAGAAASAAAGGAAAVGRRGGGGRRAGGDAGSSGGGGGGSDGRFRLAPVRVLHPPDPLLYPYGMPCADWPSDHVSLLVDFRLS